MQWEKSKKHGSNTLCWRKGKAAGKLEEHELQTMPHSS